MNNVHINEFNYFNWNSSRKIHTMEYQCVKILIKKREIDFTIYEMTNLHKMNGWFKRRVLKWHILKLCGSYEKVNLYSKKYPIVNCIIYISEFYAIYEKNSSMVQERKVPWCFSIFHNQKPKDIVLWFFKLKGIWALYQPYILLLNSKCKLSK